MPAPQMPSAQDLFVGSLAIFVGGLLIAGAALNSTPLMSLSKPRLLAERLGSTPARWVIAMFGLASIALGLTILCGLHLGQFFNRH